MSDCPVNLEPGGVWLSDDRLGVLDFAADAGLIVTSLQIGWPAVRANVRNRAMSDGTFDDTLFLGGRAVTLGIRLDHTKQTTQALLDSLAPFMSPRYRPTLSWSLAGSPDDVRALTVRGQDFPVPITGPEFQSVVASFVSPDAFTRSAGQHCQTIFPSTGTVVGRTYNLTFNRTYAASAPSGSFTVVNNGNAPTDWVATVFGGIVNPVVRIGDVDIEMTLTLTTGQFLVIDSAARTILLNGDPADSRYDLSNFTEWSWDELLLEPGSNLIRLSGSGLETSTALTICLYDRWYT
jgi:hypothetical protein